MKSIPILYYHNIGGENYKSFCKVDSFKYQMNFMFSRGYKGVGCDNLLIEGGEKLFGITFDDGYEDNLLNALPILKSYNFKATCFIVPNMIGATNSWDKVQFKLMDKIQIKEWLDEGMSIGSHSLNHYDLSRLSTESMSKEIADSKKILEDTFGISIDDFCYPYGKYNLKITKKVKYFGYKRGITTKRGLYKSSDNNYDIKRVPVNRNDSKFKFWLKTMTAYENL